MPRADMVKKIIKSRDVAGKTSLEDKLRFTASRGHIPVTTELGGVVNRKVLDAQARVQEMIAVAEAEAAEIRSEAEALLAQVDQVREQARQAGFAEGREEGLAMATELAVRLQALKDQFYESAEPEIRKLIMTIAEKVLGRLMEAHRTLIVAVIRQALEACIGDRIVVRLHPKDYEVLQADGSQFHDIVDRTKRLQLKGDESITPGGCVVETEVGTIDAQLETQLKAIRKALEL